MELNIIRLLTVVTLFSTETKKASATTRFVSGNELFFDFYKYGTPPGAGSSIKTCLAAPSAPTTVTIGVYALKAAGGSVFLRHRINADCLNGCFKKYHHDNLTADTLQSCADAVESSGWANSFSFVDDACVGYAAWMRSKFTQGSPVAGDSIVYVAEKKMNNFTSEVQILDQEHFFSLSSYHLAFIIEDWCLSTAKIEVRTKFGSQTYDYSEGWYMFEQFNLELCSMNPPESARSTNITAYDDEDQVIVEKTFVGSLKGQTGTMHPSTRDYGDVCVHISGNTWPIPSAACDSLTAFPPQATNFLTFAEYRQLISQVPGAPSHYVHVTKSSNGTWLWDFSKRRLAAEDFVSGTLPAVTNRKCVIANASENFLLEICEVNTNASVVCLDFSILSYLSRSYKYYVY